MAKKPMARVKQASVAPLEQSREEPPLEAQQPGEQLGEQLEGRQQGREEPRWAAPAEPGSREAIRRKKVASAGRQRLAGLEERRPRRASQGPAELTVPAE